MRIADAVIKNKLKNVYFLWGRGKTTIANRLREKYGFFIYSTDESRNRHMADATPENQPYMCRDFEKEYGVSSFWELPAEVIAERETHFVEEMTPMIVADLIALSPQHRVVICEGDIDYEAVAPIASHMVHLRNGGTKFDWFNRPDHRDLQEIEARTDLTKEEKARIIENAYQAVAIDESSLPEWVTRLEIKNIDWNDHTSIEQTAQEVEDYFHFFADTKGTP